MTERRRCPACFQQMMEDIGHAPDTNVPPLADSHLYRLWRCQYVSYRNKPEGEPCGCEIARKPDGSASIDRRYTEML